MLSPESVFYSTWDADREGEEGKFYTWTVEELKEILTEEEFKLTEKFFNIKVDGNFLEEATKRKTGRNILYIGRTYEELSKDLGISIGELKNLIEKIRLKLFNTREKG